MHTSASVLPGKLRICGPSGRYQVGEPIHVHDGGRFLGTIEPPQISRDGKDWHIGCFRASRLALEGDRRFGPLMLVEVIAFLAESFSDIEIIRFMLTREVEMHGDGLKVALARVALLERIGVANLQMMPRPDEHVPGNFVVQGMWEYNRPNVDSLMAEVDTQRALYFRGRNVPDAEEPGIGWLRRRWLRLGA